jgi:hypothetical protein
VREKTLPALLGPDDGPIGAPDPLDFGQTLERDVGDCAPSNTRLTSSVTVIALLSPQTKTSLPSQLSGGKHAPRKSGLARPPGQAEGGGPPGLGCRRLARHAP